MSAGRLFGVLVGSTPGRKQDWAERGAKQDGIQTKSSAASTGVFGGHSELS